MAIEKHELIGLLVERARSVVEKEHHSIFGGEKAVDLAVLDVFRGEEMYFGDAFGTVSMRGRHLRAMALLFVAEWYKGGR